MGEGLFIGTWVTPGQLHCMKIPIQCYRLILRPGGHLLGFPEIRHWRVALLFAYNTSVG